MTGHRVFALLFAAATLAPAIAPSSADSAPARTGTSSKRASQAASKHQGVLPWIEDDYARALATAKAKNIPLFIEAWAPW